jgi:hypothetical protein
MNIRQYILIAMLAVSVPALAQLSTLVEAVEAAPSEINLPTSPNGNLTFKPCWQECDADYISVRLTAGTQYLFQGEVVGFADFRKHFFNKRHSSDGYALVTYDADKNTATSVAVSF